MTAITAICIGLPKSFNGAELSAIEKRPADGLLTFRSFGIEGDMVGDPTVHGGEHMAVHHYPTDHYSGWDAWLGGHDLLAGPAAFGENLMSAGLTESEVSMGDRFRLGTVLLEVSQPRQPCWKIEHRFQRKGMVARIVAQGNCGWYYRILEEGRAQMGDQLECVERPHESWTVTRVFASQMRDAKATKAQDWKTMADLEPLSPGWRKRAAAHV